MMKFFCHILSILPQIRPACTRQANRPKTSKISLRNMSNMLDIRSIEEYNVVKYMRHKSERRTNESCERISQGTRHFPTRAS